VLAGTATSRESDEGIMLSTRRGLAILDLAIALTAMAKADDLDLRTLDL